MAPPDLRPVLRPARRDDVPAIVRLLADDPLGAARETCADPLPDAYWAAFDAISDRADITLIVAELDGEIVGCLQLTLVPGLSRLGMTRAIVEGVRVASHLRGRRIGELLVRAASDRARRAGCGMMELTSDATRHDAHRFYERLGFVASHVGMKLPLR